MSKPLTKSQWKTVFDRSHLAIQSLKCIEFEMEHLLDQLGREHLYWLLMSDYYLSDARKALEKMVEKCVEEGHLTK